MAETITPQSLFPDDTITLRWERFCSTHPRVYAEIVRIAAQAKDRGEKRLSMKWVFESIRRDVFRDPSSPVALNNDFTAPATRQLMADYPELGALFKTRKRHVV